MKRGYLILIIVVLIFNIANAVDIYPNDIRGTILFEKGRVPAPAGTKVTIVVTSGQHKGYTKTVEVDSNLVPPFLKGNGYYNTGDDVFFDCGATFAVIVDNGFYYGTTSGVFIAGGNGAYNGTEVNVYADQYKKEPSSSKGGKEGYDAFYKYIIPEPKPVPFFPDNAPLETGKVYLPPEIISKYYKTKLEYTIAQRNFVTLFAILTLLTIIILFFIYKKRGKK